MKFLIRYDMTENGFRGKFRQSKPETGECSKQFISRLTGYVTKWIDLSKTQKTFEGIRDLMVKEQYMDSCSRDLAVHLRERAPADLAQVAEISEKYLAAHDRPLAPFQPRADPPIQPGRRGRNNRPYGAELRICEIRAACSVITVTGWDTQPWTAANDTRRLRELSLHGSSEGHEMLKRNDKHHSIADDVPIPKMYFLSKSVDGLFQKLHFCV